MSDEGELELIVLRCVDCGDTFTVHAQDAPACPSCGGHDLYGAGEPLL